MVRSPADLLIRGKQDAESGMGMLGMFCQKLHQCHDLRHTGLVIRAQKGGAVRDDQVLAHKALKHRIFTDSGDNILLLIQYNITSVIIGHNTGLNVGSRHIHGLIHMRDQGQTRLGAAAGGRYVPVDAAVPVHFRILHSQFLQFIRQITGQLQLFGSGRHLAAVNIGLGVEPHIGEKSVFYISASYIHVDLLKALESLIGLRCSYYKILYRL